jgi:hypothetical protein
MPNSSNPFNLVISIVLMIMAVPIAIIGVVGMFSGGEIAWVFAMLAAGAGLMLGSGVSTVMKWRRAVARESAHALAMRSAALPGFEPPPRTRLVVGVPFDAGLDASADVVPADARPSLPQAEVLAHWTYDVDEWGVYATNEMRYRTREALWLGVGIVVLGTLFLWFVEGDALSGLGISGAVAAIVVAGKWLVARSTRAANLRVPTAEAVISPDAVLLNGKYHTLRDDTFRFGGVKLVESERPCVLEFTVKWTTSKGATNDAQIRVPVPVGREDEARAVVERFREIPAAALAT